MLICVCQAEANAPSPDSVDHSDVIIVSHGHFSRSFIARWCDFPIQAGYHFAADAGGVRHASLNRTNLISQLAVLGYQHMTLKEPCESIYLHRVTLTPLQLSWDSIGTRRTACNAGDRGALRKAHLCAPHNPAKLRPGQPAEPCKRV